MTKRAMTQEMMMETKEQFIDCINTLIVNRELTISLTPPMRFADAQTYGSCLLAFISPVTGQDSFKCALQTDENFGVTSLHIYEEHNAEAA